MEIEELQNLCEKKESVRWTLHSLERLLRRGISQSDVIQAIRSGEIIEQYPDDYPYPSCLLIGTTGTGETVHVVCGRGDGELWVITAYHPDTDKWEADLKTRKVKS